MCHHESIINYLYNGKAIEVGQNNDVLDKTFKNS